MSYPPLVQEFVDLVALSGDRTERIQTLISLSDRYDGAAASGVSRDAERRVPGCESEVYLDSAPKGDGIDLLYAVDNPQGVSAMALAVVLREGLAGRPLQEVLQVSENLPFDLFGAELSMGKSTGLTNMVRMAKALAQRELAIRA